MAERLQIIEQNLSSKNTHTFRLGVFQAQKLMERASDFMRTSKQSAVPRVPVANPWSTTLGKTGTLLRTATVGYQDSLSLGNADISEGLMATLDAAKRSHANSIRNAPLLRQKMLMSMAAEVSLQRKCAPSSAIRQIQNAEESKRPNPKGKCAQQKHRFILEGRHQGRIKTVVVPIPSLTKETIWGKLNEDIALKTFLAFKEWHLMSSSISHFRPRPPSTKLSRPMVPSPAKIIKKQLLDTAYGYLSNPVSSILAELKEKKDKDDNPLKFDWTFDREAY